MRERRKLEAEVVEKYRFNLRMNPLYQQLASEAKNNGASAGSLAASITQGERDHIRHYVGPGKAFYFEHQPAP